jgi:hypothetical protein
MLQQAKNAGALPESRFRVDALPEPGREYERQAEPPAEEPKLLTQAE